MRGNGLHRTAFRPGHNADSFAEMGRDEGFWSPEQLDLPVPLEFAARGQSPARTAITRHRSGACEIAALDCPAGVLRSIGRGAGEGDAAGGICVLLLHRADGDIRAMASEAGLPAKLQQGDFILHEVGTALTLQCAAPARWLLLSLPQTPAPQAPMPQAPAPQAGRDRLGTLPGRPISGADGPGALFSTFLCDVWNGLQDDNGPWSETLSDVLWPMIDMISAQNRANLVKTSRSEERRDALLSFIDRNIYDPDLDTNSMAQAMGTSARYVQMLLSEIGTTPSGFVRNRRLELAATRLAHGGPQMSITQTAFDVGFNDLSSFCRAFRNRFQVAPRDYRAGCRPKIASA